MAGTPRQAGPVGLIVATHGGLAESLVKTTEIILARKTALQPFTFKDGEPPKASFKRLEALVRRADRGAGVVILADLFGGTPGSMALSMLEGASVEVVTGVNLPMAITAASLQPGVDLAGASAAIARAGKDGIKQGGEILGA